jgi:hypothetical protein
MYINKQHIYYLLPLLFLTGCASNPNIETSVDKNNYFEISSENNLYKHSKIYTSILPTEYIEKSTNKPGPYPIQYLYTIANHEQEYIKTLFKPIEYFTPKKELGWGTCYLKNSTYYLSVLKNNKIIYTGTSPEIEENCQKNEKIQEKIDLDNFKKNIDQSVKEFSNVVDSSESEKIFGPPPKNPIDIIKKELPLFIENVTQASFNDISVRKTFLNINNEIIYCYLVFSNISLKDSLTNQIKPSKKAIFYFKNNSIIQHKVFTETSSGLKKGQFLKSITYIPEISEENYGISESLNYNLSQGTVSSKNTIEKKINKPVKGQVKNNNIKSKNTNKKKQ